MLDLQHHDRHQRILTWLSAVPNPDSGDHISGASIGESVANPFKRRRERHLPSPSMSDDDEHLHSKRLCLDPDVTPVPNNTNRPPPPPPPQLSSTASSRGYSSTNSSPTKRTRSGKRSPTKGMSFLRLDRLVSYRSLTDAAGLPPPLGSILQRIKQYRRGLGILSLSDMESLKTYANSQPLVRDMLEAPGLVDSAGLRVQFGTPPPLDTLLEILADARECEEHRHSEAGWNTEVHAPLLRAALRKARVNRVQGGGIRVGYLNATTASIIADYVLPSDRSRYDKRVDFCVYVDPGKDHPLMDTIHNISDGWDHYSINHTDYTPLLDRPISISIETKRTGEDWNAALSQTSAWLAGHWRRLEELMVDADTMAGAIFLPAIIIQGHDWMFAAATRGRKLPNGDYEMVFWTRERFGSTDDLQGIYQIVAVLQCLTEWSAVDYWPWFCKAALRSARADVAS